MDNILPPQDAPLLTVIDGWIKDVSIVPKLTVSDVESHLRVARCNRQINGGWSVKQEGYVRNFEFNALNAESSSVLIRAKCFPSMKSGSYNVYARIQKHTSKIVEAYCDCPAGLSETCTHVSGLLFTIAEACEKRDATCTDILCKWIDPRSLKRPCEPKPLQEVIFKKCLINKIVSSPTKRGSFNPSLISSSPSVEAMEKMKTSFQTAKPDMMWLRYASSINETLEQHENKKPELPSVEYIDIGSQQFLAQVDAYIKNITPITTIEKSKIVKATVGQANNPEWFRQRVGMMTASVFGKISKCFKPDYLVKEVLYPSSKSKCEAIRYGRDNEQNAVDAYVSFMSSFDKHVTVHETGLHVSCEYPYIGASPDRIVFDGESYGILEVKCPISQKGKAPEDACKEPGFYCQEIDGAITLKKKHNYYLQVQGQLALTGYTWCDFVIWTNNGSSSIGVDRMYFNEKLWLEDALPSLQHFYKHAIVPEIISKRVKQCGKLYRPTDSVRYISFQAKRKGKNASTNVEIK